MKNFNQLILSWWKISINYFKLMRKFGKSLYIDENLINHNEKFWSTYFKLIRSSINYFKLMRKFDKSLYIDENSINHFALNEKFWSTIVKTSLATIIKQLSNFRNWSKLLTIWDEKEQYLVYSMKILQLTDHFKLLFDQLFSQTWYATSPRYQRFLY